MWSRQEKMSSAIKINVLYLGASQQNKSVFMLWCFSMCKNSVHEQYHVIFCTILKVGQFVLIK